jgi:hemerythrin-like metal-binding protein
MAGYELIVWNDDLVTGVDKIDAQHRILVNSINEANTKLSASPSAEVLDQISLKLLGYALYHFETEEELMQRFNYAEANAEDAAIHLRQHRTFSSIVVSIRERIKEGQLISREELFTFFNSWLIDHVLKTDKHLAAFILEKGGLTED